MGASHTVSHLESGAGPSQAEADFTRLFNLSPDLLCIAGLDGFFRRVNPSWTRVLGWSEAELLSRPVASFMHPDDRERTLQARADLARGIPVRGLENRYLCKDGSYRWLSWQSVTEPGAPTVFAVARDITERRQLDYERLVMGKLESTALLAGGLAHDFNNLLTGLALNLEMLPLCGPTTPPQEEQLKRARQMVQVAKTLTDRLIALAAGRVATREVCDLRTILQESLDLTLTGSGIRRDFRVASDLWPIEADREQITEVFRSLLLNAREAIPGAGTISVHAENVPNASGAPAAGGGDGVRIRVTDDGVGIAPDVLPKVFDPYFSTKQRGAQKGMGLGLTTCRVAIQAHGGTIAIESRPQFGTTVTCFLPARSARTSEPRSP